jgi:hypothetical protein
MVARQIPASWRYLKARRSNRLEVMSIFLENFFLLARLYRCSLVCGDAGDILMFAVRCDSTH